MALTFKLDDTQHQKIVQAIKQGFDDLVEALTGTTEARQQALIDEIAAGLNITADEIQMALNQPKTPKGE